MSAGFTRPKRQRKILQRALGVHAVQRAGGNLALAEQVVFGAEFRSWPIIRTQKYRSLSSVSRIRRSRSVNCCLESALRSILAEFGRR